VAVFARHGPGLFVALHGVELGGYFGALDEGVEDVEHGVAAPGVGVVAQELELFVGWRAFARDPVAVAAEGFELVDEFVDDVPGPVILFNR